MIHGYSGFHYRENHETVLGISVSFAKISSNSLRRISFIKDREEGSFIKSGKTIKTMDHSSLNTKRKKACNTSWAASAHSIRFSRCPRPYGSSSSRARSNSLTSTTP
jgi:hypothetical protein